MNPPESAPDPTGSGTRDAPLRLEWTTDGVPESQRLAYWTDAVSSALFEMGMSTPVKAGFSSFVRSAPLDAVLVTALGGSQREAVRSKEYIGRANRHSFHILVDFTKPWVLNWRGTAMRLEAGDVAISDTRHVHSAIYLQDALVARHNIKLPPHWAGTWLRNPDRMAGRIISRNAGWGAALSAFVAQLTPALAVAPPLPAKVLTDQLGSLLSLVESEMFPADKPGAAQASLACKIIDLIRQRSNEISLVAGDVSLSLGISERTMHRHLQAAGKTFSALLQESRIESARRMLESPQLRLLTTAEIGFRSGFGDPSHFARVLSLRLGKSPKNYRMGFV